MKRSLTLLAVIFLSVSFVSAQNKFTANRPEINLSSEPGYITINEFTAGFGLKDTSVPYSKSFFGFTTIHGYQIDKSFVVAGGTGVHFYNNGTLVPLFIDVRYRIIIDKFTPYAFGDGGLLLDFSAKKDTRLFINPGIGVRYTINRNFAVNLGTGLFSQFGDLRDSFINLKTGVTYKF
ncbi:MAG: hypothetical protein LLG13_07330 [Bacteroidales bacterium]|nr:hypothetical protein [Bacteroidales bacterium]